MSNRRLPPASFFGIPLGLAGLGLAWRAATALWHLPGWISEAILAVAVALWALLIALYGWKWLAARADAVGEIHHPVQCCFVGLAPVTGSLCSLALLPYVPSLAFALFLLGGLGTLAFALYRTGQLWQGERDVGATTPILYLPAVAGSFVTAIVAASFGLTSWAQLAFGAGFFSWLAIESVLLHRLYVGPAIPPPLRPTLGIQLAPPAVGALAYVNVGTGGGDLLSHALIGYALLQALLLIRLTPWFRAQPFAPSYWAFSFGAAALAGASVRFAAHGDSEAIAALAPLLFIAANLLIGVLALGTASLWLQGKLLPPPALTMAKMEVPQPGKLNRSA
jgi:tellurite resistance protein